MSFVVEAVFVGQGEFPQTPFRLDLVSDHVEHRVRVAKKEDEEYQRGHRHLGGEGEIQQWLQLHC